MLKINKQLFLVLTMFLLSLGIQAQEKARISGGIETNANFFIRDSIIGADDLPQYDHQFFGAETWVNLVYSYQGYEAGLRFDMFNNSNLLDPNGGSYSDQGIGNWYVKKKIGKLGLHVGYIYDQIGSGLIYRAYEKRPLLIDNALYGVKFDYQIAENWQVKAFTGKQKNLFETWPGIVKGASIEGFVPLSDSTLFTISPGFGVVNRTLDESSMEKLVNVVKNYIPSEQDLPVYNAYSFSLYNTLNYKKFAWYMEGAYKSPEVFFDATQIKTEFNDTLTIGKYHKKPGSVLYTSLSYATRGLGITLEAKRTENFNSRVDPTQSQLKSLINYIPPINRENTYRLTARYSPTTQDLSELALQAEVRYALNKRSSILLNGSHITTLDGETLYDEIYVEYLLKKKRKYRWITGIQYQKYNQKVYLFEPSEPDLVAITPFMDFLYKLGRKKSIRIESQYMITDEDYGSWLYGLVEYATAPHWSFELSAMYNIDPKHKAPKDDNGDFRKILYPTAGVVYSHKSTRYSLRYVKQVEGIVCAGGVCRLEPAFSGVKLGVTSSF